MSSMLMKTCAFVDGENLRGVIRELFAESEQGAGLFNSYEYLPKNAKWGDFFRDAVSRANHLAGVDSRWARTYWYVIEDIDTAWPPNRNNHDEVTQLLDRRLKAALGFAEWRRKQNADGSARILSDTGDAVKWMNEWARAKSKSECGADASRSLGGVPECVLKLVDEMWGRKRQKEREFRWKRERESAIENDGPIRFRRSGHIRFDPLTGRLGEEKTVDVNLALDMLMLRDSYDIALIVSGDQDFVPAVRAAQDAGKTVVNVVFLNRDGKFFPGGAKRLNAATDWSVEIGYDEFRNILSLPKSASLIDG